MISLKLITILGHLLMFCHQNNVPCELSSLTNDVPRRMFLTHKDGRAADVKISSWPDKIVKKFIKEFTEKFNKFGAYSFRDAKQRLVVLHEIIHNRRSLGLHLHLQVKR